MKKALIISGGGCYGAFGAGTLARLNKDYDVVGGISTGALMGPFVALKKWDALKEAYTTVKQNDIIDKKWYRPNPIKKNGKINILAILYALLLGKKTAGTTESLKKLIDKFLTEEDYYELRKSKKNVFVGAQNLNELPSKIHYFDIQKSTFVDFKDWMWASANAPFFTSVLNKKWYDEITKNYYLGQWVDGGVTEMAAMEVLNEMECSEVDIILHRPFPSHIYQLTPFDDLIESVNRNLNAMRYDIEFEMFNHVVQELANKGVKVTVYWLPRKLGKHFLLFNQKEMESWWNEGYETAYDESRITVYRPQ